MRSPDFYAAAAALASRKAASIREDLKHRRPSSVEIDEAEMHACALEAGSDALCRGQGLLPVVRKAPAPPPARPLPPAPPVQAWREAVALLDRRLRAAVSKAKVAELKEERGPLARNIALVERRDALIERMLFDDELLEGLNSEIAAIVAAPVLRQEAA